MSTKKTTDLTFNPIAVNLQIQTGEQLASIREIVASIEARIRSVINIAFNRFADQIIEWDILGDPETGEPNSIVQATYAACDDSVVYVREFPVPWLFMDYALVKEAAKEKQMANTIKNGQHEFNINDPVWIYEFGDPGQCIEGTVLEQLENGFYRLDTSRYLDDGSLQKRIDIGHIDTMYLTKDEALEATAIIFKEELQESTSAYLVKQEELKFRTQKPGLT